MAGTVDLQGVAEVIAALGVAIPAILTTIMQAVALRRGVARDKQMAQIHDLVNGQSTKLNAMAEAKGFVDGGDAERANPTEKK